MPYMIVHTDNKYCVHKEKPDGSPGQKFGCHNTRSDAVRQIQAILANEKTYQSRSNKVNIKALLRKAVESGVDITDETAMESFLKTLNKNEIPSGFKGNLDDLVLKHTITGADRPDTGWLYQGGPFSLVEDEPISSVVNSGSMIQSWIPSRLVDYRFENVNHIEWIAPVDFDGTNTYREYLNGLTIADCDYGPYARWSGFEYQMDGGKWSFSSPVMKEEDFGLKDYERSPIYRVRGGGAGMSLDTDAEWALAQALFLMKSHMEYLVVYGDKDNSVMEMDGLDKMIQTGYVQSKLVGGGVPHWANPLVVNAANVTTFVALLGLIRSAVRKLRGRITARNWSLAANDMAVLLPAAFWPYLADAQASGSHVNFDAGSSFSGQMTYRDFLSERSRVSQGGLGMGFIDVDGLAIPVIADGNLGRNITIDPLGTPTPAVIGDIMILTRRVNGMTLLEQQYVDYTKFDTPDDSTTAMQPLFGGLLKAGWKNLNNECYQYYTKASGRMVTYFQPLQARIDNVVIETTLDNENEAGAFWAQDFYAADGGRMGTGTALLTPL